MSARFDAVNLAALPAPAAVQVWSFTAILAARQQYFLGTVWPAQQAINPALPTYNVQSLESNPGFWLQSVDTYREGLVLQRINEAVLATSLAYATGDDLTVVAADYKTLRQPGESDAALQARAQLAWENLSIGGSYGGYQYQALSAAPQDIADVAVYGYDDALGVLPGEVRIVVLGASGNGVTPQTLLNAVMARVNQRATRKVNDRITVVAANVVPYTVDATLIVPHGADGATVQAAQLTALTAYLAARQVIGGSVTYASVMGALGSDSPNLVADVIMRAPWNLLATPTPPAPIGGGPFDAPICTGVRLLWQVAS
jgi:phage-related baseplate assembly protein